MGWDPEQFLDDFLAVAELAGDHGSSIVSTLPQF